MREYTIGENTFEIFFENISPSLNLLIFGAGYDALPLMKFAREIGWRVTAIDHRPAFADAERLRDADEIIVSNSEDVCDRIFQDENSVAVIMTHNYERDRNILRRLLNSNFKYIGALGPKKRTEKLLDEIGEMFQCGTTRKTARARRFGHRRGFAGSHCSCHRRRNPERSTKPQRRIFARAARLDL